MSAHRTVFAAMLLIVSACATATTPEQQAEREEKRAAEVFANDVRRGEEVDRVCFTRIIDSFGETTNRAVVIREGRDHYLVETFGGCFDLDWAQSLAFDSATSCLTRGDRLYAFDSAFGQRGRHSGAQFCTIKAIYNWDKDAEEKQDDADESDETSENVEALETAALD